MNSITNFKLRIENHIVIRNLKFVIEKDLWLQFLKNVI
jgi:hypothetical protein